MFWGAIFYIFQIQKRIVPAESNYMRINTVLVFLNNCNKHLEFNLSFDHHLGRWYFETFAVHTKDLYFFWYVNEFFIRCAKFIFARFFLFCFRWETRDKLLLHFSAGLPTLSSAGMCGAAGRAGGGCTPPPPYFGRPVNPISTRGADYVPHITTRPHRFSDFPLPFPPLF